jgi:hypothetical protein
MLINFLELYNLLFMKEGIFGMFAYFLNWLIALLLGDA